MKTLPEPYYQDETSTIYCGDCREILPNLGALETIVTDPVWPNSVFPDVNPAEMLREALAAVVDAERLVIHLGCDSDPRFLCSVPNRWPFLRVCWLDYARPSYKGRILYGSDVAYVFGDPPKPRPGQFLMPGKCMASKTGRDIQSEIGQPANESGKMYTRDDGKKRAHPCPRRIQHVQWLIHHMSEKFVCDPFMGSGTTIKAAKELGRKSIGIEINQEYCELAKQRLAQEVFSL